MSRATALLVLSIAVQLGAQAPVGYFLRQPGPTPDSLRLALAYDQLRERAIVIRFDSQTRTTWEYNGTGWSQSPAVTPYFTEVALCYDPLRQRTLAVGTWSGGEGVMEFDGVTWTQVPGAPLGLTLGVSGRLVFDIGRGVMVFFTNGTGSTTSSTWERVGTAWFLRTTGGPPARSGFGFAYDPVHAVAVLHGGTGPFGHLGDTWQWNGTYWLQRLVPGPVRYFHAMVFDPYRARVVFYGGYDANNNNPPGISEWDGTAWTQSTASGVPAGNVYPIVVDFPPRQSLLFVGHVSNVQTTFLYRALMPTTGQLSPFGSGCAGTGSALGMQSGVPLPRVGGIFQASVTNVSAGAFAVGLFGTDNTQWNGVPLPVDLGPMGFTGCTGYLSPESSVALPAVGSTATWNITVPPELNFVGVQFYLQGAALLAGVNPGGALFSNGLAGRLGTP